MNRAHRQHLGEIFHAAVTAVDPLRAVRAALSVERTALRLTGREPACSRPLDRYGAVRVVGCGKAGAPMAAAVEELLGGRIVEGVVTVKYGHGPGQPQSRVRIREAGHPLPDRGGMEGATEALRMLQSSREGDLVIALISGGGSALWPLPAEGLTLDDKQRATDLLLGSGADIGAANCVRKHLSAIKGGRAAAAAAPAEVLVLAVSDVIGDPLDVIASGPFCADPTTFADAVAIVKKCGIEPSLPEAVRLRLRQGSSGEVAETPKPADAIFANVTHRIVASNRAALDAAAVRARELGYVTEILDDSITGDVGVASSKLAAVYNSLINRQLHTYCGCVISGGETTVTLGKSCGKGGRNQELALHLGVLLDGSPVVSVLSAGTDGTDGPTDAAGAFVDGTTVARSSAVGKSVQEAISRHDSYHLLDSIGDLFKTGPTRTNVMDIQIALISGK